MAVLSLDRLSKRFGARLAVNAVSFEVAEREIFGALSKEESSALHELLEKIAR